VKRDVRKRVVFCASMIAGCGAPPAPVAQDASPPKELAAKFSEVIAASPDAIARALVEDWQCTRVEIVSADHLKVRHTGSWSEFANERPVEVALITDVRLAKVADGTQVSFETLPEAGSSFVPIASASRARRCSGRCRSGDGRSPSPPRTARRSPRCARPSSGDRPGRK
jgi:hypothetical protein